MDPERFKHTALDDDSDFYKKPEKKTENNLLTVSNNFSVSGLPKMGASPGRIPKYAISATTAVITARHKTDLYNTFTFANNTRNAFLRRITTNLRLRVLAAPALSPIINIIKLYFI